MQLPTIISHHVKQHISPAIYFSLQFSNHESMIF